MSEFASFRFLMPYWLLLLPLLWGLVWFLARHHLRPSSWRKMCDPHLLEKLGANKTAAPAPGWLVWPLVILLTLAILAVAGPSWRDQSHPLMESANARIVALDLSQSMLVQDVKPDRFSQAIAAAREIIEADFEGETGLLVFSGAAFVVSPLSRDANTLLAFLDALEPGIMPLEGNRLDLAIDSAQDLLQASISGRGQIVIITSGSEQNSRAVQAASLARSQGHQVSIMAIGTSAGGPLIDQNGGLLRDGLGKLRLSRTSFTELERVTRAGGGILVRLTESDGIDNLLGSRIVADNLVEAMQSDATTKRDAANDGVWLVWLMLPFGLLLFRKNLLWIVLMAVWLPPWDGAYAAEQGTIWQHRERLAYEAYQQGDFERASELSEAPLLQASAYYRSGFYQKALETFAQEDSAKSHYNRGNVLVRLERLPEAIEAYSRALTLDPSLGEAKYNRRLIEVFLQQQSAAEQSDNAEGEGSNFESQDQSDGEGQRPGIAGQEFNNPADEESLGTGYGASIQSGQRVPLEQFDGLEQELERFSLAEGIDPTRAEILVESWVNQLPAASSELFRHKFMRDYQRQRRQPR